MLASSKGAVNFTFTATCGRKLCAGYTLYTARADEHKNKYTTVLPRRTLTFKLALSLRTREISSIS